MKGFSEHVPEIYIGQRYEDVFTYPNKSSGWNIEIIFTSSTWLKIVIRPFHNLKEEFPVSQKKILK